MLRSSSWFRRTACALTTAHLLIFAVAPFLEAVPTTSAPQSITIDNHAAQNLPTRAHDSETCPACVLLNAHASQTASASLGEVAVEIETRTFVTPEFIPQVAPESALHSRAPPAAIA